MENTRVFFYKNPQFIPKESFPKFVSILKPFYENFEQVIPVF